MKLIPLCRLVLKYDDWSEWATLPGEDGMGYASGGGEAIGDRLSGSLRWTHLPWLRSDNVSLFDHQGVIKPEDGSPVIFRLDGYGLPLGGVTSGQSHHNPLRQDYWRARFTTENDRYAWLNTVFGVAEGGVLNQEELIIGVDVFECVFEWRAERFPGWGS